MLRLGYMTNKTKQKGIALITAMLVVSLAAVAAVAMSSQQQISFHRAENVLYHEQAYMYLLGAEDWAIQVLARDLKDNSTDSKDDDWATLLPPIAIDGGTIAGQIEDIQGRFNINNLATGGNTSPDAQRFIRLLSSQGHPTTLVNAVIDWLDADQNVTFPEGAEDGEYLQNEQPYRAANRLMSSVTELLQVKGFTYDIYESIAPGLVALPVRTDINVNTANAVTLQAIVPNLSSADAEKLIQDRDNTPFDTVNDFLNYPSVSGNKVAPAGLTVSSQFFVVTAHVQIGRARVNNKSLVRRQSDTDIVVLQRSLGEL